MDSLIRLLRQNSAIPRADLARQLGQSEAEVAAKIAEEKRKKDDIEAKARADADERTRKREEEQAKKQLA
jgi:hypothetical protein